MSTVHRPHGVAFTRADQALWLSASIAAYVAAYAMAVPDWRVPVIVVAALSAVHGAMTFYRSGGDRLSSAGVFCFTTAILLTLGAYPAFTTGLASANEATAAVAAFTVQVLCTPVRPSPLANPTAADELHLASPDRLLESAALAVFVVALASQPVLGRGNAPGELLALGAIVLIAIVRATSRPDMVGRTLLPGLLTIVYAGAIHSGDGRLRLVSAIFVVMFLGSLLDQGKRLKIIAIASLPFAIFMMAWLRLRHVESVRAGLSEGRNGLESGIVPLRIFADLLEAQGSGAQALQWGATYLSVPSRLTGFVLPFLSENAIGYELVGISEPERYGSGFSLAGLAVAEAVYNFGLLAVPILGLVLAAAFARLDDALHRAWLRLRSNGRAIDVFVLAALVTLWSGIPDFAWGGSHTLFMRVTLRIVPLLLIGLVFSLIQRDDGRRHHASLPSEQRANPEGRALASVSSQRQISRTIDPVTSGRTSANAATPIATPRAPLFADRPKFEATRPKRKAPPPTHRRRQAKRTAAALPSKETDSSNKR